MGSLKRSCGYRRHPGACLRGGLAALLFEFSWPDAQASKPHYPSHGPFPRSPRRLQSLRRLRRREPETPRSYALCWRLTVSPSRVRKIAPPSTCGGVERLAPVPAIPPPSPPGARRGLPRVGRRKRGHRVPRPLPWSSFEAPRLLTSGQSQPALS